MQLYLRILPLVFFLFVAPAFGQKIKEKDDIVYVDDQPYLKIFKEKTGGMLSYRNYHVLSLQGDTLARFLGGGVLMRPFGHETNTPRLDYFTARFAGTAAETRVEYGFNMEKVITRLFLEHHLLGADGKPDPAAVDTLVAHQRKFVADADAFHARCERRKTVLADKNLVNVVNERKLVQRNYADDMKLNPNGRITVGQVVIGTYRLDTDNNYGLLHTCFNLAGKPIGSIFLEKGKGRVFIREYEDKDGHEVFLAPGQPFVLLEYVRWFTDLGIL